MPCGPRPLETQDCGPKVGAGIAAIFYWGKMTERITESLVQAPVKKFPGRSFVDYATGKHYTARDAECLFRDDLPIDYPVGSGARISNGRTVTKKLASD